MKTIVLSGMALGLLALSAGVAAAADDGGFGTAYFTGKAPAALDGTPDNNLVATDADAAAAALNEMSPAAGDAAPKPGAQTGKSGYVGQAEDGRLVVPQAEPAIPGRVPPAQ